MRQGTIPQAAPVFGIPVNFDPIGTTDRDLQTPPPRAGEIALDLSAFSQAHDTLLGESSLAQWLLTKWLIGLASGAKFSLGGYRTGSTPLQQLMETHPGRLLALLPVGSVAGVTKQAAAIVRDTFIRKQQDWPGLPVEPSTALYCVDGHPSGLPRQLYSSSDSPTDWEGFRAVVNGLIQTIGVNRSLSDRLSDRANSIANILFELFKNTHEHARTGAEHEVLGYSVRGLYARYYDSGRLQQQLPNTKDQLFSMNLNPAQAYAWSVLQPEVSRSDRGSVLAAGGLLELSVFDTGPGLAARWHGHDTRHLDISTELEFVLNCLAKGRSTSNRPARGFGLWNVLQELRGLRGFFRIRTNRIHMYREFNAKRDAALVEQGQLSGTPREVLFDWKRPVVTIASEFPHIVGTSISVLLPLRGQA